MPVGLVKPEEAEVIDLTVSNGLTGDCLTTVSINTSSLVCELKEAIARRLTFTSPNFCILVDGAFLDEDKTNYQVVDHTRTVAIIRKDKSFSVVLKRRSNEHLGMVVKPEGTGRIAVKGLSHEFVDGRYQKAVENAAHRWNISNPKANQICKGDQIIMVNSVGSDLAVGPSYTIIAHAKSMMSQLTSSDEVVLTVVPGSMRNRSQGYLTQHRKRAPDEIEV